MDSNLTIEEHLQSGPARAVGVTGGAGFIGSVSARAQGSRHHLSAGQGERVQPAAEFITADIALEESLEHLFDGIDCVFHAAALPRVPLSIENPPETHMADVVGTINVLIAARNASVRRVIFSGSSSMYGDQGRTAAERGKESAQPVCPAKADRRAVYSPGDVRLVGPHAWAEHCATADVRALKGRRTSYPR